MRSASPASPIHPRSRCSAARPVSTSTGTCGAPCERCASTRRLGPAIRDRLLARAFQLTGNVFDDLSNLEAGGPRKVGLALLERLEQPSMALPLAALSLLGPLSLHLVVALVFFNSSSPQFGSWAALSLVLVGHAHLAMLVFAIVHIHRLRTELDLDIGSSPSGARRGIWAAIWAAAAAAVPGALLFFIPPVLVLLTGLAFAPLVFHWAARRGQSERQLIESWGGDG